MAHFPPVSAGHLLLTSMPNMRDQILKLRADVLRGDLSEQERSELARVAADTAATFDDVAATQAAGADLAVEVAAELRTYARIATSGWGDEPMAPYHGPTARHDRIRVLVAVNIEFYKRVDGSTWHTRENITDELESLRDTAIRDEMRLKSGPDAVDPVKADALVEIVAAIARAEGRYSPGGQTLRDRADAAYRAHRPDFVALAIANGTISAAPGPAPTARTSKPARARPEPLPDVPLRKAGKHLWGRLGDWLDGKPAGSATTGAASFDDDDDDLGPVGSGAMSARDRYAADAEAADRRRRRDDISADLDRVRRDRRDQAYELSSKFGFQMGSPEQADAEAKLNRLEDEEERLEALLADLDD